MNAELKVTPEHHQKTKEKLVNKNKFLHSVIRTECKQGENVEWS